MLTLQVSLYAQLHEIELLEAETEDNAEEMELYYQEIQFQKIELNAFHFPDEAMLELADSSVWNKIREHRFRTGWYFSPYEIQSIAGLDSSLVKKMIPFLNTEIIPGKWKEDLAHKDIHYLSARATSDNLNSFSGRYRRGLKDRHNLNISFRQFAGGRYTARGNAWIQPAPRFRILAGHYKLDWGQGLLMGTYAPGKNAEPIRSVMRIPQLDIPWNSSGMHARGVAIRYAPTRRLQLLLMCSSKKDPATVRDSLLRYWLWQADGKSVLVQEDQVSFGIIHKRYRSETGILSQYTRTNVPQLYWNNQASAVSFSLHHKRRIAEKNFAGELAFVNFKPAATASLIFPVHSKLEGALNVRAISSGYFSRYMNSFGLSYNAPAQIAWYQSLRYYLNRKITMSLSYDKTQRAAEKGMWSYTREEVAGIVQFRFSKTHSTVVKIRNRITQDDESTLRQYHWQVQQTTDALPLRLKVRMQGAFSGLGKSLVAGGELEYKKSGISFLAGVSFFKVDHYSLKESWYERPVFLSSGFSWLYDQGIHRYVLITCKPTRSLSIWFRGFLEEKTEDVPVMGCTIQVLYNFVKE